MDKYKNISIVALALFGVSAPWHPGFANCVTGAPCVVDDGSAVQLDAGGIYTADAAGNPALDARGVGSTIVGADLHVHHHADEQFPWTLIRASEGAAIHLRNPDIQTVGGIVVSDGAQFHQQGGKIVFDTYAIQAYGDADVRLDDVTLSKSDSTFGYGTAIYIGDSFFRANNLDMQLAGSDLTALIFNGSQVEVNGSAGRSRIHVTGDNATAIVASPGEHDMLFANTALEVAGANSTALALHPGFSSALGMTRAQGLSIRAQGEWSRGIDAWGTFFDNEPWMRVQIQDSTVTLPKSASAMGVDVHGRMHMELERVTIDVTGDPDAGAHDPGDGSIGLDGESSAILLTGGSRVALRDSQVQAQDALGLGVDTSRVVPQDGTSLRLNHSTIEASGNARADGIRVGMLSSWADGAVSDHPVRIEIQGNSAVSAADANALRVASVQPTVLAVQDSVLSGNRLILLESPTKDDDGFFSPSPQNEPSALATLLDVTAQRSRLAGGTKMDRDTTLAMRLRDNTEWRIHPSRAGETVAQVSFLDIDRSVIRFSPGQTGLYQKLIVGYGALGGRRDVYRAGENAQITLNTYLNAGGALSNQRTDRLIVHGDVSGTTWLRVQAIEGSPGAETGHGAGAGISLVQVYGNATAQSFALVGGYASVAGSPWQYQLHAFDPQQSDPAQRDPDGAASGAFWDFRLQSSAQDSGSRADSQPADSRRADLRRADLRRADPQRTDPLPVPQIPSYLAAPGAMFQARLFDLGTWHRRLGEAAGHAGAGAPRDTWMRVYGGDLDWRAGDKHARHTDIRYHAVQLGGGVHRTQNQEGTWSFGLAASVGELRFAPRGVDGSQTTRLTTWFAGPTLTWQGRQGAYVDAVVAVGGFHGDVQTRQRGKTGTLKGRALAASVEVGVPYPLGENLTVVPQVQAVAQSLKFDRMRDVDGFVADLGRQNQWMLRAGGEIRKIFSSAVAATDSTQVYAKLHLAHTPGKAARASMGNTTFRVKQVGSALETGLGIDATLNKGKMMIYADVTRQTRVGHTGSQGWTMNLGARIRF